MAAGIVITAPATASASILNLPAPHGGYRVGTTSLHLIDTARTDPLAPTPRPRELMVRLWYPAIPSRQPVAPYQTLSVSTFYTGYLNAAGGTQFPDDLLAFPTHSRENAPAAGFRHPVVLFSPAVPATVLTPPPCTRSWPAGVMWWWPSITPLMPVWSSFPAGGWS